MVEATRNATTGSSSHTHTANTAKHTKGAKQTMSAYTPCALRFYTLVKAVASREDSRNASCVSGKLFYVF